MWPRRHGRLPRPNTGAGLTAHGAAAAALNVARAARRDDDVLPLPPPVPHGLEAGDGQGDQGAAHLADLGDEEGVVLPGVVVVQPVAVDDEDQAGDGTADDTFFVSSEEKEELVFLFPLLTRPLPL